MRAFLLCVFSVVAFLSGSAAHWIWYPGDFETYLAQEVQEERLEWGGVTPVMWPQYHHYPLVAFSREYDVPEDETIDVWVDGKGSFEISEGERGSLIGRHLRLFVPKGHRTIRFLIVNSKRVPSVLVRGRTIESDGSWSCEHSHSGEIGPCDCADDLTDPDVPPADFALPQRRIDYRICKDNGKGGVLADYGEDVFGFLTLRKVSGTGRVKVIYGESEKEALADGLPRNGLGNQPGVADVWEYVDVKSTDGISLPRTRAFRYVNVVPMSAGVRVGDVSVVEEYSPLRRKGSFKCSDQRLNRIWEVSAKTLQKTAREFLVDGVKRDRWIWSGDAYQSIQMSNRLFGDAAIVRRTLWALRGKDPVWRHVNTISDYTFYWFAAVAEYYLDFGDADFLRKVYPRMRTLMDFVEGRLRSDGLYEKRPGDWVFLDWAPEPLENEKGPVAAEQILLSRAYESIAVAAEVSGDVASAETYRRKGRALRERIKPLFWSEEHGALIHAVDSNLKPLEQFTRYANIFGLMYGYFNEDERTSVIRNCIDNPDVMAIQTPYMHYYELEAQCLLGRREKVLEEIREYWGGMLDLGATTFWELYNPRETGDAHLAMYGRTFGKSLCHAWAASPVYLLSRYFLGVRPTAPGYAQYEVRPELGGLEWMEGEVPTPSGTIRVSVKEGHVTVSGNGGRGVLVWKGRKMDVPIGGVAETDATIWDVRKLEKAPASYPVELPCSNATPRAAGVRPVWIEGEPFRGKPTRIFAWWGLPENASETHRVPAMVLVHGGGGTAFDSWVRKWNDRGYAALALDTCGAIPQGEKDGKGHPRHPWSGPGGWDCSVRQVGEPFRDQWTYQAVAAIMRCHSFLRARPEVEAERTGITGISWGGYLTSIVMGVDNRFKFAAPVYGCGFYGLNPLWRKTMGQGRFQEWLDMWDPANFIGKAKTSVLWCAGTNDRFYPLDQLRESYSLVRAPASLSLALRLRMPHGHPPAGDPPEIAEMADFLLKGGPKPITVTDARFDGRRLTVSFDKGANGIARAELLETADRDELLCRRQWTSTPIVDLDPASGRFSVEVPMRTTLFFANIVSGSGLIRSTRVFER